MKNIKIIFFLVILFILMFITYLVLEKKYIKENNLNYTNSIKSEIKNLITTKELYTYEMAKSIAEQKKLINFLEHKSNFNFNNILKSFKEYSDFKNINIHIFNKNAYLIYANKKHSKKIKEYLHIHHLCYIKHPKYEHCIKVMPRDIVFKAIVPIYHNDKFLGFIELFTHFNSIIEKLQKNQIYSAVIVNKKFTPKKPLSNLFINGYYISNIEINNEVIKLLKKYSVNYFIHIKSYTYIPKINNPIDGYFVINVPILHKHTEIGHFISFIYDKYDLAKQELILHSMKILMGLIFLLMTYFAYKENQENKHLITSLDKKIKEEVEEKVKLLYTDSLTGAYKKTKLQQDRKKYLGYDVVMLNIKNFSKINEIYGFRVGDTILKITVRRIEKILNKKIYRINADEFVFIDKNGKKAIMSLKHDFLENPIKIEEKNIILRISFNFSIIKNDGNELLRKLSIALKESKKLPFKDYVYYEPKETKDDFLKFNELLYDAIFIQNKAKIIPYFQKIHSNKNENILKFESLARLECEGKIYSPYFFIDIATNSGFICEITKIMIDKTFSILSKQKQNTTVSINITEDDLLSNSLKPYLLAKLKQYNIESEQIILEILEGITSVGTKNNIAQLNELKELGFKIAIDDFGVEYSNFERISELDVDFIKIDGKYIKNINNPKHYKIVKAIVDFAHSMGIDVIAEFVEDENIQNVVIELGIEYSQGYYFSKPQKEML